MRMTLKQYFDSNSFMNDDERVSFKDDVAFIGVDLQNDFGNQKGSLYVQGGEAMEDVAIFVADHFDPSYVFWTKDWHPANHCSFKDNGGIWPTHCVNEEWGSELLPGIFTFVEDTFILKGTDPLIDSYSAFFDNEKKKKTELDDLLKGKNIKKLVIMGIATDYCVKFTVLHALELGYEVALFLPGCVGVGPIPGVTDKTVNDAVLEMEKAGAVILEK